MSEERKRIEDIKNKLGHDFIIGMTFVTNKSGESTYDCLVTMREISDDLRKDMNAEDIYVLDGKRFKLALL